MTARTKATPSRCGLSDSGEPERPAGSIHKLVWSVTYRPPWSRYASKALQGSWPVVRTPRDMGKSLAALMVQARHADEVPVMKVWGSGDA